jgi:PHD/YefM family antitoxin component YafN of YafNO toxin-antitoxin module
MTTQFLTDQGGKRVAVVLPGEDFDELMEDVSDLAAVAVRRNEERFTLDQVKKRLIAGGLLSH